HLGHRFVGLQARLDLGGGDVLAGAADDLLLTTDEVEHAVVGLAHDVPGVEPAAPPRLLRRLGVLEIAREEPVTWTFRTGPAHEQLALDPALDLVVLIVDDARVESTVGTA